MSPLNAAQVLVSSLTEIKKPDPVVKDGLREEIMRMFVRAQDINISFSTFPYYLRSGLFAVI